MLLFSRKLFRQRRYSLWKRVNAAKLPISNGRRCSSPMLFIYQRFCVWGYVIAPCVKASTKQSILKNMGFLYQLIVILNKAKRSEGTLLRNYHCDEIDDKFWSVRDQEYRSLSVLLNWLLKGYLINISYFLLTFYSPVAAPSLVNDHRLSSATGSPRYQKFPSRITIVSEHTLELKVWNFSRNLP